jgi:iron(III) transport system permease protein
MPTLQRGAGGHRALSLAAWLLLIPLLLPLVSLFSLWSGTDLELWAHMVRHVLPYSIRDTAILTIGVAVCVALTGSLLAALTAFCDFPGRRLFQWAAVLPLAFPTYLSAYIYVELLDASGPVQTAVRALSPDARFPEIRSAGGAIAIFSIVLFPYVYLPARVAFARQSADFIEVARTLGTGRFEAFRRINLPLARPAIAGGIALALMETLSDIGAAEYLGVRTLAVTIYTTWLSRGSIAVAGQLAIILLLLVIAILLLERALRGRGTTAAGRAQRQMPRVPLTGIRGALAAAGCGLPILLGFVVPFGFLLHQAVDRSLVSTLSADTTQAIASTFWLAAVAAAGVVVSASVLALWSRQSGRWPQRLAASAASYGYAVPSVVLALCVIFPAGAIDNALNRFIREAFGFNPGLLLTLSGGVLVFAYWVRFQAIGFQLVDAGLRQVSARLELAGRSLGRHYYGTLKSVTLPLVAPSLLAAAALVFVDVIKELPLTLLLRPIGIDTLATNLYGHASRGAFEDGAAEALLIAMTGLVSVAVILRTALSPAVQMQGRTAHQNLAGKSVPLRSSSGPADPAMIKAPGAPDRPA